MPPHASAHRQPGLFGSVRDWANPATVGGAVGTDGTPRDPWQFTNTLIMKEVGADGRDEEALFTFTTSSRGGLNCVGELCRVFGRQMRMRPDEFPIVELGVDSYKHSNPEFGKIKVPLMEVVGWEPRSNFGAG